MAGTSMIKRNRLSKLNALGATMAVSIAKEHKDPMYTRYKRLRDRFINLKKQIIKKYANKGKMAARTAMSKNTGIKSLGHSINPLTPKKINNMTSDIRRF
jgi:cysteine sulfinate desulfinase/cysteine desulfurase-like protein